MTALERHVRQASALLWLGLQLLLHILTWPLRMVRSRGRRAFELSYVREGLTPVSAAARARMPEVSGCLVCGLCDHLAPRLDPPLSHRIAGHGRSGVDLPLVGAELDELAALPADALRSICPAGVELGAFLEVARDPDAALG